MNFGQIASLMQQSLTGRALIDCAVRSSTRFGLRGGVTRNLLLERSEESRDLYDAVDPFSDIDIVVEDKRDGARLLEAISASVPFAGFYRWEVMVLDSVVAWLQRTPHFALDEFVIWVDGKSKPTIMVSHLTEPNGIVITDGLKSDELVERFKNVPFDDLVVSYMRLLTILARREKDPSNGNPIRAFQELLVQRADKPYVANDRILARMDLHAAKLFGSSVELGREAADLAMLTHLLGTEPSKFFSTVATLNRSSVAAVGVWRSDGKLRFNVVDTSQQSKDGGRSGSHIPSFTIPSRRSGVCCPYSDFREGPAVVMWRRPSPYKLLLERSVLLAFEKSAPSPDFESADVYSEGTQREGVQIPNVIAIGRGLIARMDHAFLGALLGRTILMQVTVREIETGA